MQYISLSFLVPLLCTIWGKRRRMLFSFRVDGWKIEAQRGSAVCSRSRGELLTKPDLEFMARVPFLLSQQTGGKMTYQSWTWEGDAQPLPPSPGFAANNTRWALCQRLTHTAESRHFLLSALLPTHIWALMVSLAKRKSFKDRQTPASVEELCPVGLFL